MCLPKDKISVFRVLGLYNFGASQQELSLYRVIPTSCYLQFSFRFKVETTPKTFSLLTNPYTCLHTIFIKRVDPLNIRTTVRPQATPTGLAKTWFLIGFKIIRDTWIQVWNDTKTLFLLKPICTCLHKLFSKGVVHPLNILQQKSSIN